MTTEEQQPNQEQQQQQPELLQQNKGKEEACGGQKRPAATAPEDANAAEANAKLPRVENPTNPEERQLCIRQQIEYYMSDRNLRRDKFFNSRISNDPEGWLPVSLILGCRKIQALGATSEEILEALKDSELITRDGAEPAVRRTAPPPPLDAPKDKPTLKSAARDVAEINRFGVLIEAAGLPEEVAWAAVKTAVEEQLEAAGAPAPTFKGKKCGRVRHASNVTPNGTCYLYFRKFSNDLQILSELSKIEINGQEIKLSCVSDVEVANKVFAALPPPLLKEREYEYSDWRRQIHSKPIQIGSARFESVEHLRKCCKEVLDLTKTGDNVGSRAFPVISAVLDYHPNAAAKKRDMVAIRADERTTNNSTTKCFFVVRSDGTAEDFSLLKCINFLSRDPPYFVAGEEPVEQPPSPVKISNNAATEAQVVAEAETSAE